MTKNNNKEINLEIWLKEKIRHNNNYKKNNLN